MVSSVINPKGTGRANEMLRVNEFIYFLWFGKAQLGTFEAEDQEEEMIAWETMRGRNLASRRGRRGRGACGPNQFYPIYINRDTGVIQSIGDPLPETRPVGDAPKIKGCTAVFPIRPDGTEMNWSLTADACRVRWKQGYVRAGSPQPNEPQKYIIQFLPAGAISDIESGNAEITERRPDGSVEGRYVTTKNRTPTTQWNFKSHYAEHNGTLLLKAMLPDRMFPFPKSLYAVEDALRLFVGNRSDAVILDFFAGSGTTGQAVMRLNRQDNGRRQCILITNNEVSINEEAHLRQKGLRPGDREWESMGICEFITKPRIEAAITGKTPAGEPIQGTYKFLDEFPLADGFEESAEFFTLTYETPIAISHSLAFKRIAPLLWMRAGSEGSRIDSLPSRGWEVADTYGLLTDLDQSAAFCKAVSKVSGLRLAYIVADDDRRFQAVARRLPETIEPVRLYELYLSNFQFTNGE